MARRTMTEIFEQAGTQRPDYDGPKVGWFRLRWRRWRGIEFLTLAGLFSLIGMVDCSVRGQWANVGFIAAMWAILAITLPLLAFMEAWAIVRVQDRHGGDPEMTDHGGSHA